MRYQARSRSGMKLHRDCAGSAVTDAAMDVGFGFSRLRVRPWSRRFAVVAVALSLLVAPVVEPAAQAAPTRAVECPAGAVDGPAALRAAVSCKGRVEVESARSERIQVFANPTGSFTSVE